MAAISLFVLSSAFLGFINAEPDYCKRGMRISGVYQHCFEQAHFAHPYRALRQPRDIIDGCMVEAYASHTCRVVKPEALACFRLNISVCDYKERLYAIADESGGACYGDHINREFKEHVLNFLQPVRADSDCFILGDRAYECYSQAGIEMADNNPRLHLLSVEDFIPVVNRFFDSIYECFIKIYESNRPMCENWQIPLLLELQGTALPSLFGMTFMADQMDRLGLHRGCPVHHLRGEPSWRICYDQPSRGMSYRDHPHRNTQDRDNQPSGQQGGDHQHQQQQQAQRKTTAPPVPQQQQLGKDTPPPFLQRLREEMVNN